MVGFTTGFGSAPPATGGSEVGSRGKEGFYQHFGTTTLNRSSSGAGSRAEGKGIGTVDGIMVGFATGLGMAPPATGGSEVSPCGEASSKQPQIGFSLLSLSVLGTGTPSTGTSVTSSRGEGGFYRHFGTGTLN